MEGESGTVVIRLCAAVLHCRSQGDGLALHESFAMRYGECSLGAFVREAEAALSCGAQCHAADDELREQQIDDGHGQDGDGDHHVHLAHIELQEVCTAQLRDQDGQGLLKRNPRLCNARSRGFRFARFIL